MHRHLTARGAAVLCWGAAVLLSSSCTLAPKYERPEAPVPSEWPSGPAYEREAAEAPRADEVDWPEFFSDEQLRRVIALALENNRDLAVAALNVERARALYAVQRDELFPALQASASHLRQRVSEDFLYPGQPETLRRHTVDFGIAAWEIDFFGRIRSLKDAALERYLATEYGRRSAQLLLVSAVAQAYLALAADRENLRLAETTLKTQEDAYALVKRRLEIGIGSEIDLYRVQVQVEAAREAAARYRQLVAQDGNALALLVGAPVPEELLPTDLSSIAPPREVSAGLPSEVLLRRPDVLQAESLLRAAYADIGAARAAFFPRISLTAAFGTASEDLASLFHSGTWTWMYAPQLVMPIFDARTWSAYRVAKVQRELALKEYERAIQVAFRDVADVLAVRGTVREQLAAQESLVKAAAETYRLALSLYEKGLQGYLSVLDAQRSLFAAEQGLVSLRLAELASRVRLYAVLGGGWKGEVGSAEVSQAAAHSRASNS